MKEKYTPGVIRIIIIDLKKNPELKYFIANC
jgi:hypothetical protein